MTHWLITRVRNLFLALVAILKKPRQFISKLFAPKVKPEIDMTQYWIDKGLEEEADPDPDAVEVAVEPSIVFEESVSNGFSFKSPTWFLKIKRVTALLIFVGCSISVINLVTGFRWGLLFVVPTAIINLDYLFKTQPKTTKYAMHILDDVEELKH